MELDRATPAADAHSREPAQRVATVPAADTLTPADRYQELFEAVQRARVFADSKTFVDCIPRQPAQRILDAYRAQQHREGFDLANFVHAHFKEETAPDSHYTADPNHSLKAHIDDLWRVLTRRPHEHPAGSSILPLPCDYVVPGGRFREIYYWDSYFIMLGLVESGRRDLLAAMADNFAWLIDHYGHVPNGNRSYYLSRSQPPVFTLMISLFEECGLCKALTYLPQLRREYAWWMDGADALRPGDVHRHCVRLEDGGVLNRYWDDRDTPREESFLEDETTAARSVRPAHEVYRDLRAAAASGWDFGARWCDDAGDLSTTRTTAILPVDLNSLLFAAEQQLARLSDAAGLREDAADFTRRAQARRASMLRWMWDEPQGAFVDVDWQRGIRREVLTVATSAPLFVGLTGHDAHATRVARTVRERLLAPGGIATSEIDSGQQWDSPNGWAPLQWLAIKGFARCGQQSLARDIAQRWLHTVGSLYQREGKLVEKYALTHGDGVCGGGGGEYPLQDGFGWTNGVTRRLLRESPDHPAHCACAGVR